MKAKIIIVHVIPQASSLMFVSRDDVAGVFKVKLTASPDKGKANKQLITFLSSAFDIPTSSFSIIRGHTSRKKYIAIQ